MYRLFFFPLLLILLFFAYDGYFPPPWPDEVLFSSAAIQLAKTGQFRTDVLTGIVYGMDKATLWNSPLYMIFLSLVYQFADESLLVGRLFSLFIGILCSYTFYFLIKQISKNSQLSFFLTLILLIDLSFSRAANIMRMDILNLLFVLLCLYSLEKKNTILSGIFMGLSGLTHPISIFLVPIAILYNKNSYRNLLKIGFYAFIVMVPWFLYIYQYWDIFHFQFLAQFSRKSTHYDFNTIIYLIKVFGGQYQNKINFVLIYLFLLSLFTIFIYDLISLKKTIKYFIIFVIVLTTTFLSSEAWYSIYPIPFGMIYLSTFINAYPNTKKYLLLFVALTFILIQTFFWYKAYPKIKSYKQEYIEYINFLKDHTRTCKVVYLQSIPDPYFDLPKDKVYKEFPPYGLFKNDVLKSYADLRINTYKQIDCFVITNVEKIDEVLIQTLNQKDIKVIHFPEYKTLPSGSIYIKF